MGFFRFFAALLLVGVLAIVGVSIYNAGVSAGISSDIEPCSMLFVPASIASFTSPASPV